MTGPNDDDATRIVGKAEALTARAVAAPAIEAHHFGGLPAGYRLHEFAIESTLGEGGFGLVYLAQDLQLRRQVAIKEFMPSALARRGADYAVSVKSDRYRETFEAGLRSFVNEAQLLAQFDHPSLVKVYRFWEQNGTAYMVMPYYRGVTFKDWLRANPGAPSQDFLLKLVHSLLDPLEQLHARSVFHRDIAPDNILLLESGLPVLLDFGAARQIIGDMTQALTVILKSGYAPIEQYAEVPSMRQGPWTDIYALSAVLYCAVTGRAPPPSVGRMLNDEFVPAATAAGPGYAPRFLAVIDRGLRVEPDERPRSIAEFRALFDAPSADPVAPPPVASRNARPGTLGGVARAPVRVEVPPPVAAAAHAGRAPGPGVRWLGIAGLAALLAGAVIWWLVRSPGPERPENPAAPASAAAGGATAVPGGEHNASAGTPGTPAMPAMPANAAVPPPVPAQSPAPADVPGASQSSVPPLATAGAGALPPLDPSLLLRQLYEMRAPALNVTAKSNGTRFVIGHDALQLSVTSEFSGYLYVLMAGTESDLFSPFANQGRSPMRIKQGVEFPLDSFSILGPPGVTRVLFLVSPQPLFLDVISLGEDEFPKFDLRAVAEARKNPGALACTGVFTPCRTRFGAALLEVSEVTR